MKIETHKEQRYMYYLNLGKGLSSSYFHLSRLLSNWGISLIPIRYDRLGSYVSSEKQHLIVSTRTLTELKNFKAGRKKRLDFFTLNKKLSIHHISSFGKIDIYRKLESLNCYHGYQLPMDLNGLVQQIAVNYLSEQNVVERTWPGGRRARLPELPQGY